MSNLSGIKEVFERCIRGEATQEDRLLFWEWVDMHGNEGEASKLIENAFPSADRHMSIDSETMESIMEAVFNSKNRATPTADLKSAANTISPTPSSSDPVPPVHRVHFLKTAWFRYAAILLLIAGTATFLYVINPAAQKDSTVQQPTEQPDILPGGNKAILTLADGSTIILDNAADGSLAQQGNTRILKVNSGSLAYQAGAATGEVLYNTISTPKGGQYQITLPDGSQLWLNAASSITFPTAFGEDRKISITGEVYFEIKSDKNKPFVVSANGTDIQVLGTRFNVNAYPDEASTTTTLIDGSVRVVKGFSQALLQPGQQAQVSAGIQLITDADTGQASAWKNGLFNFEGADTYSVMRQLARWYDIEVKYEGRVPAVKFRGKMERDFNLSEILEILNKMGIQFRLENRTLIVLP